MRLYSLVRVVQSSHFSEVISVQRCVIALFKSKSKAFGRAVELGAAALSACCGDTSVDVDEDGAGDGDSEGTAGVAGAETAGDAEGVDEVEIGTRGIGEGLGARIGDEMAAGTEGACVLGVGGGPGETRRVVGSWSAEPIAAALLLAEAFPSGDAGPEVDL